MRKLTQVIVLAAATLMVVSTAIASASPAQSGESSGPAVMPLNSRFRACDFTLLKWVNAVGYARGIAHLSTSGSTMNATVDLATAEPNMHYDARVIQTPRASIGCAPGAPGVLTASIETDAGGFGSTTIQGPIMSNATGAWVMVTRPSAFSQTPAEFYSSTFIAPI